jgi:molybdate transport system substrate-binding protein
LDDRTDFRGGSRPAVPGRRRRWRASALVAVAIFAFCGAARTAEVHVMISGGFSAAYRALAPEFERSTGHTLKTTSGPSMGNTPEAIPKRLERGEPADVVIMVGSALDGLIGESKVIGDSRVDLARSRIGMVVRAGATKPDIGSVEAFKRALLAAKSIAYSDSASGVYLSKELFPRLGVADQIAGKSRMIPGEPVAAVVARGEAEIGFQQISELLPVPGADLVGALPPELQKITVFSAGIVASAKEPEAGRALIRFLTSAAAVPAIEKSGLEPAVPVSRQEGSPSPR